MAAKSDKPKEAGFRIRQVTGEKGLFFPFIKNEDWKQGDPQLIEAVTGKDWEAFVRLVKKHGLGHVLAKQGYLAVAVQRKLGADVDGVVEFIKELPLMDGIELEWPDDAPKDGEEGPTKPDDETAV